MTRDQLKQVTYIVAAFLVGYGTIQIATGYRYVVTFDWSAIINGLVTSGLYTHALIQSNPFGEKPQGQ